MKFTFESIDEHNLDKYKGIVDSILYICDYSGFDKNDINLKREILEPDLPLNGIKENNRIVGVTLADTAEPVAWVQYYLGYSSDETVFLGELYIDVKQQGNGIGAEILEILEVQWISQGVNTVVLNVDLKNWQALRFWIGQGFTKIEKYIGDKVYSERTFSQLNLSKDLIKNERK